MCDSMVHDEIVGEGAGIIPGSKTLREWTLKYSPCCRNIGRNLQSPHSPRGEHHVEVTRNLFGVNWRGVEGLCGLNEARVASRFFV